MIAHWTIDGVYQHLSIPHSCLLGKRIFKKHFYEHGQLDAADRKAFAEDIESIEWRYTLKPSTINIPRFDDDVHEYLEIAVVQVTLTNKRRTSRIAQVMQKTIPYPLLLLFTCEDQIAFNAAEKRINRADAGKMVVEAIYDTGWMPLGALSDAQKAFLADFSAKGFSYQNLFAFYQDMVKRIVALNCAAHTGQYVLDSSDGRTAMDRLEALREIEKLQQEQAEIRNKLKKEKNLGTQVRLNMQIRRIKDRIATITADL